MSDPQPDAAATDAAPVLIERDGARATVRLNRPEAMNALDTRTKAELLAALREVAEDRAVRVVVLTGTGRAFCVGQDLREHAELIRAGDERVWSTVEEHYNPIVTTLATMDKPVIAALNGVAAGAGASFALAADLRIMVSEGGVNLAFAGVGLSCDSGSSWTLQQLIGPARAKELLLMPRTLDADECLRLGLVTEVVEAEGFAARVDAVAARLAAGPTRAYGAIRRSVTHAAGRPLAEALAFEARQMALTGASADHQRAVEAFLAKLAPEFTGE